MPNSYADAAADSAHRICAMKVQHEILSFFARKQQQMVGILVGILRRIARVAKAANDMLTTISKKNACGEIHAPIFSYTPSSGLGLSFINAIPIQLEDPPAVALICLAQH